MVAARTQTEHKNNKNTTKKTLQSLSHLDTAICALKETETKQTLQEIRLLDLIRKWLLFFSLILKMVYTATFIHAILILWSWSILFIMKVKTGIGLNQKRGAYTMGCIWKMRNLYVWKLKRNSSLLWKLLLGNYFLNILQTAIVLKSSYLCHFESESDLWTNCNARWFFIVLVSLVNIGFLWHII